MPCRASGLAIAELVAELVAELGLYVGARARSVVVCIVPCSGTWVLASTFRLITASTTTMYVADGCAHCQTLNRSFQKTIPLGLKNQMLAQSDLSAPLCCMLLDA
eukprot:COSAG06_NODE_1262_length_10069_cov_2.923972_11_plen_105_part_00